jgi:hypothetical protein
MVGLMDILTPIISIVVGVFVLFIFDKLSENKK